MFSNSTLTQEAQYTLNNYFLLQVFFALLISNLFKCDSLTSNYVYIASAGQHCYPFVFPTYVLTPYKVLVSYDYFLLLPLEVSEIWMSKISLYKALFLLNRYVSIFVGFSLFFIYVYHPATNAVSLQISDGKHLLILIYRRKCQWTKQDKLQSEVDFTSGAAPCTSSSLYALFLSAQHSVVSVATYLGLPLS